MDIKDTIEALNNYEDILNPDNLQHLPNVIKRRLVMKRVHIRQVNFKIMVNKEHKLTYEDKEVIAEAVIFFKKIIRKEE